MSGIDQASAIVAARRGLFDAITTALAGDADVDIRRGSRYPAIARSWVITTGVQADTDIATLSPQRSQDERITLTFEVGSWLAGSDDDIADAAFGRAYGLLSTIQNHVRVNDITLGGTVLWAVPGPTESDGDAVKDDEGSGFVAVIAASFIARHRIRTSS